MNRNRVILIVYVLFLVLVCTRSYRSPQYNWDVLPYMAMILEYEGKDAENIHSRVYAIAESEIPAAQYRLLIDSNHNYRARMHQSAEGFAANYPYYVVKPAYNYGNYLFYSLGIPLAKSTVLFSILGYLAIGILVLEWLRKHISISRAVLFSSLIMTMPFMLEAVALSTPDVISAFFVLLAFYFLLQKDRLAIATSLLLISILFRLDNILPFLAIQTGAWLYRRKQKPNAFRGFLLSTALGMAVYFLISMQVRSEGWDHLYFTSFINRLSRSYDQSSGFSWNEYVNIALSQVNTAIFHSHLVWFAFVSALLIVLKHTTRRLRSFVILLFVILMLRFILHPVVADRFYLPYYLVMMLLLVSAIAPFMSFGNSKPASETNSEPGGVSSH